MRALTFVLLCLGLSFAQVETVRIDFGSSMKAHEGKSLAQALGLSLLLPGSGEYYLEKPERARWFWGAEVLSWVGVYFTYQYSEAQLDRLYSFANKHANAQNLSRHEEQLQLLGEYRSRTGVPGINASPDDSENYEQSQFRRGEEASASPQLDWNWGSDLQAENGNKFDRYKEMLREYRTSKIALQVSIGALAFGRLISLIDVFQVYRQGSSGLSFETGAGLGHSEVKMVVPF